MNSSTPSNNANVIIEGITDDTLTLNVNGEVKQIHNQLDELKTMLQNIKVQKVQYAEKIYNIENINEANFGFVTGKKAFNEHLTKSLITNIRPHCLPASRFLERVSAIPNWENQLRISDKAKEIISYSFVGVLGIQLSKLMAIGKEDFSEAKQRKYMDKCLYITKRCLDLVNFSLLSKLWDERKQPTAAAFFIQSEKITQRFDTAFEQTILEQFELLKELHGIFTSNNLLLPISELSGFSELLNGDSDFYKTCQALQTLNENLDKAQYTLVDCFEAETKLADFLQYFAFLATYRMASIKHIGYRQIRNTEPHFLHRYTALGIDSKANVNAEKVNYTKEVAHTDSVLLYKGDNYKENINLFPFVIDFNALSYEHGAKICFYRSTDITDGSLEYVFLEDSSIINIELKGILTPDTDFNELMMDDEKKKTLNQDNVVIGFREARKAILGDNEVFLDDL